MTPITLLYHKLSKSEIILDMLLTMIMFTSLSSPSFSSSIPYNTAYNAAHLLILLWECQCLLHTNAYCLLLALFRSLKVLHRGIPK
jgi:hypothetical protein